MAAITVKEILVNGQQVDCIYLDKRTAEINLDDFSALIDQRLNTFLEAGVINVAISFFNVKYPGDIATAVLVKYVHEFNSKGGKLMLTDTNEELRSFFKLLAWEKEFIFL